MRTLRSRVALGCLVLVAAMRTASADIYGYLTTSDENRLWGGIVKAHVKPEGELFPSFTAMALAAWFVVTLVRRSWTSSANARATAGGRRIAVIVLSACLLHAAACTPPPPVQHSAAEDEPVESLFGDEGADLDQDDGVVSVGQGVGAGAGLGVAVDDHGFNEFREFVLHVNEVGA